MSNVERRMTFGNAECPMSNDELRNSVDLILGADLESSSYHKKLPVGAASSRDHLISRLAAAPTTNVTCFFKITVLKNMAHKKDGA